MVTRTLIRYPHLIWLTGFLLPVMYVAYLINLPRIALLFKKASLTIFVFVLFTFLQIFSALLSVGYDFFTIERFFAILHNIIAFSFIFFGYSLMKDEGVNEYVKKTSLKVFVSIFIIIILGTIYSLITNQSAEIPSIFSAFGIHSKFTTPIINILDWYLIEDFPRTQVLGIYPNSTGLLLLFLYFIIISLNFPNYSQSKKLFITLLLIIGCFLTGSRAYLFLSFLFLILLFIKNKSYLVMIFFLVPMIFIGGLIVVQFLSELRAGSNDARSMIYLGSFNFMWEVNPYFGLGIKPRLEEVIGVPYPLGSHSTIWGYIIKCGIAGAFFMTLFLTIPVYKSLRMLTLQLFTKKQFSKDAFFLNFSFVILLVALALEDVDAFEILPFYFGIILFIYENQRRIPKEY